MITKQTTSDYLPDFSAGEMILIDKPLYLTSFSVVYKVRKVIGVQKVGHTGTLDPMATGLLIVCTGKATKEINKFTGLGKTYTGIISVGKTTPSFDSETEFVSEKCIDGITDEIILEVKDSFLGNTFQTPPMYSAIKHKGKALYKFARKGLELERKQREIHISKFEITKIELPDIHFEINCSAGTYIRVIANDFGRKLGSGAYLKSLRRIDIGSYDVKNAFQLIDFTEYAKQFSFVG